jgi:hypothetical protein
MGSINSSNRIAATLYSLGTWFVSGICVSIPCIKEIVMMMMMMMMMLLLLTTTQNKSSNEKWHCTVPFLHDEQKTVSNYVQDYEVY